MQDEIPPNYDNESDYEEIYDRQMDDVKVHDTESEQDISEGENEEIVSTCQNEEEQTIRTRLCYRGQGKKDKTYWKKHSPATKGVRNRRENLSRTLPTSTADTKNLKSPIDVW
ncbi:hypothetical protein JTB14_000079 [Gonioctena quinquepunctata]|nr:hypothetical protein JTB14_000079 [Gonioctena quinquepunctata]